VSEIGPGVLERLRRYDTPTVCNLIELFDVRPRTVGYMDARACWPDLPPMVGFAATATFRASGPPRGSDVYSSTEEQVERFEALSGYPQIPEVQVPVRVGGLLVRPDDLLHGDRNGVTSIPREKLRARVSRANTT
jgi:hypothetical protein